MMGKVAVLLKGVAYSCGYRMGVNYKKCIENYKKFVLDSLIRMGHTVDVFVATYDIDGLKKDEIALDYNAKEAVFLPFEGSCQKNTLIKGLESIDAKEYDWIIVTRFDIEMKIPMDEMDIDWNKINFPWKEIERYWNQHKRIGDVLTIIPKMYIEDYMNSINQFSLPENIHIIYPGLVNILGKGNDTIGEGLIHFICEGFYDSAQDNPLYSIIRSC